MEKAHRKDTHDCLKTFYFILFYFSWSDICQGLSVRGKKGSEMFVKDHDPYSFMNFSLIGSWDISGQHVFLLTLLGTSVRTQHFYYNCTKNFN